ncbi:septum formation initiator [Pilimelia columellifera]|uniref:Septum formation initiator n=1 Tax=Pilimelia columellifera subsp. columellifera TaxID=706583 RepID=A0ABN3N2L2_9ACTN
MRRAVLISATVWLAVAAGATAAGLAAVAFIGDGLGGVGADRPLSTDEVARQLAAVSPAPPAPATPGSAPAVPAAPGLAAPGPTASGAAASRAPGAPRVLTTPGGSLIAACGPGRQVTLLSWTPAPGYATNEVERGPDHRVEVTFTRADERIEARVECSADAPQLRWRR